MVSATASDVNGSEQGGYYQGLPSAPSDQLEKYISAKSSADHAVAKLLQGTNAGHLDAVTYRSLMLAHDQAFSAGHRVVTGLHFLSALVIEPSSRERLSRLQENFQPANVLKACAFHLLDEPSRLATAPQLPRGSDLEAWIDAASRLTLDREEQNQAIEVGHLFLALRQASDPRLELLRDVLGAKRTPTLAQLMRNAHAHIARLEQGLNEELEAVKGMLRGQDERTEGQARWLGQKLDVVDHRLHSLDAGLEGSNRGLLQNSDAVRAVAANVERTAAAAQADIKALQASLRSQAECLSALTLRRLSPWAFVAIFVCATSLGGAIALFLRP